MVQLRVPRWIYHYNPSICTFTCLERLAIKMDLPSNPRSSVCLHASTDIYMYTLHPPPEDRRLHVQMPRPHPTCPLVIPNFSPSDPPLTRPLIFPDLSHGCPLSALTCPLDASHRPPNCHAVFPCFARTRVLYLPRRGRIDALRARSN